MPRYANRVDKNQSAIVDYMREQGAIVEVMHLAKMGFPDLVAFYQGRILLVEVKRPRGKLTKAQKEWHKRAGGYAAIVRSIDEATLLLEEAEKGGSIKELLERFRDRVKKLDKQQ